GRSGGVVRAARWGEQLRVRRRYRGGGRRARDDRRETADPLPDRTRSVHGRSVLGDDRGALPRQPAGVPRPGPALLLRGPADRGTAGTGVHAGRGGGRGAVNDGVDQAVAEKGSRKMLIGLILTSVVLAGFAQITLKTGVNHVTDAAGGGELHISA